MPAFAQLYGQHPIVGQEDSRSNKVFLIGTYSGAHTPGTLKWSWSFPGYVPIQGTGTALGEYSAGLHGYRVYAFATAGGAYKLFCLQVNTNTDDEGNTSFTVLGPVWNYTCDGTPRGTPVLGHAGNVKAVYVVDATNRIHCVKESDGSRMWRSAEMEGTLSGVLYTQSNHAGTDGVPGYRLYVNSLSASGSKLHCFETSYSGVPIEQGPNWGEAIQALNGHVVGSPTRGNGPAPPPDAGQGPYIYTTTDQALLRWYDLGPSGMVVGTFFATDQLIHTTLTTTPLVVTNGSTDRIYIAGHGPASGWECTTGHVWAVSGGMTPAWSPPVVTQTHEACVPNPPEYALGRISSGQTVMGCSDKGTSPVVYYPSENCGGSLTVASISRFSDLGLPPPQGYGVLAFQAAFAEQLLSAPVFVVGKGGAPNLLYYYTSLNHLYITSSTGALLVGSGTWPKTIGLDPYTEWAVDADGAIVGIGAGGTLVAYWGL